MPKKELTGLKMALSLNCKAHAIISKEDSE
jgi:hypothetical protein